MTEPTDEMVRAFMRAYAEADDGSSKVILEDAAEKAGLSAVLAIVERDRKAALAEAAAAKRPSQEMLDAYAAVAPSGQVSVWGVMAVLAIAERDLRARIAYRIRAELVCCDVYEQSAAARATDDLEAVVGEGRHAICYWGEAGARIAEDDAS